MTKAFTTVALTISLLFGFESFADNCRKFSTDLERLENKFENGRISVDEYSRKLDRLLASYPHCRSRAANSEDIDQLLEAAKRALETSPELPPAYDNGTGNWSREEAAEDARARAIRNLENAIKERKERDLKEFCSNNPEQPFCN